MRAMILEAGQTRLKLKNVPSPDVDAGQVRVRIEACGVCRTDLHVVDGDLRHPKLPLIPGHEIVGRITELAPDVTGLRLGQRVGVPWLGWTCGTCLYCRKQQENLCDNARFTGYTLNGGFAETCVADARYVFPLSETADPVALAPLLCAGLIGFRSLRMAGDAQRLGFYGFGAAAHILAQIAVFQGREVYASRPPATLMHRNLPDVLAQSGRAVRKKPRLFRWMPPSSLHRSVPLCHRHSDPCAKGAVWYAPGFT